MPIPDEIYRVAAGFLLKQDRLNKHPVNLVFSPTLNNRKLGVMIFRTRDKNEFFTDERCFITEILNTPDISHLSIAQARVAPGVTTALHRVEADEIYCVLEGQGAVEINDQRKEPLNKGDIAFIKAGFSQRITNVSDTDLVFLCICTPRFTPAGYTSLE